MFRKPNPITVLMISIFTLIIFTGKGITAPGDDRLTVISPWKTKSLDPIVSGYVFTRMGCFEPLTAPNEKGEIAPRPVQGWDVSEDRLKWTFTLRPNAFFHDGTPVTGNAAAAALKRVLTQSSTFRELPFGTVRGDGNQVIIKTTKPFATLPAYLAHYSTSIIAPASYDETGKVTQVIGTGFYKLALSINNSVFDYVAFDQYWGKAPCNPAHAAFHCLEHPGPCPPCL